MEFGLLLPHFGLSGCREYAFELGPRLAALGFSSAWVRDHLGFSGGVGFERDSHYFVDPLITMAAVAATSNLTLGTAALTPFRQPVVLAQVVGALAHLAGGRLILGVGLGKQSAVDLAGYHDVSREDLFEEMVRVLRACSEPSAAYHGKVADFENLSLDPAPPKDLDLWYCGSSLAGVGRAVEFADGWLPGRCPFPVLDRLMSRLRDRAAERGKTMDVGIVPLLSWGRSREEALSGVNVDGLLRTFASKSAWRVDSQFTSVEDLRGAVIAGSEQDVMDDLHALEGRGIGTVIFDLRERMDAFDETLAFLGERVIPTFTSREQGDEPRARDMSEHGNGVLDAPNQS